MYKRHKANRHIYKKKFNHRSNHTKKVNRIKARRGGIKF